LGIIGAGFQYRQIPRTAAVRAYPTTGSLRVLSRIRRQAGSQRSDRLPLLTSQAGVGAERRSVDLSRRLEQTAVEARPARRITNKGYRARILCGGGRTSPAMG
jgi:hypothetical protein